jgi:hypothetical protein
MLRFLKRPALVEHINFFEQEAKSRWQAESLKLI